MTLCSGGQVVINNKFMFPQKVLNEIVEKKCTIFAGVPGTYQIMLRYTKMESMDLSCLRYALQAGGKLSVEYLKRLKGVLPKTNVVVMYGQTEATARLSYLPPELFDSKIGSIGKGIPGVELRVVNEREENVEVGEIGEITARGKNISPGYLNNEEETKKTFRGGWLYTGDLARIDKDGFIFIVGRKKDFVKVAGYRFSLTEIEDIVHLMEGIKEAAALMIPDEILGEAVRLFVVPDSKNLTPESVIAHCKKKLPTYKIPKQVTFVNEIPKNASGKPQKRKLLESGAYNSCMP